MGALALRSERASGVVTLREQVNDIDGDQANLSTLPANFGDCILLDVMYQVRQIATTLANPTLNGPTAFLAESGDRAMPVGQAWWRPGRAAELFARVFPEFAMFWRANDTLETLFAEVDTNAVPTADLVVYVTVLRLRGVRASAPVFGGGRLAI